MKYSSCILSAALVVLVGIPTTIAEDQQRPVPLIFDTDMGNDIDDALALGVLHALASRGECALLAVTITKDDPESSPFVDALNTFYGRGHTPIGIVRGGAFGEPSRYTKLASERDAAHLRYEHDLVGGDSVPDAVQVLRESLVDASDGSIVIVQVGFSTNLAHLLSSPPDTVSKRTGKDLVRRKVRLLSMMAGGFRPRDNDPFREYNILGDIDAAQQIVDCWPTPIVFSGIEIGNAIEFPGERILRDFAYVRHHPLAEAYLLHSGPKHNRPSWDLTSVLYAVRPDDGYFSLSPKGRVRVTEAGETIFAPSVDSPHRYLIANEEQCKRVKATLVELTAQRPDR